MKKIVYSVLLVLAFAQLQAQSIAGTWKRTATILEYANGEKEDLQKNIIKNLPCMAEAKYVFKADGTHYTESTGSCKIVDRMSKATWKQSGTSLELVPTIATQKKQPNIVTSYTLSFGSNSVTMVHVYTTAENAGVRKPLKRMVVTYVRY
jgi:hypothetical protein